MSNQQLTIGYYGNGKSTNRYHLPFLMRRQAKIRVKTIYARTLKNDWPRWENITYTNQVDDLLTDTTIDVVVVTTPPETHYQIAKQVLLAGKNVVLEKPFTHSVAEAQELFDLAKAKGLMIQGYQNRRFDSDFLTTQSVIESGKLGPLTEVEMHFDYFRPEVPLATDHYDKASSYVYNHACHTVDQVLAYFGQPTSYHADVRQLLGTGRMNDYFDLDFYYQPETSAMPITPGGLKVSIKSSYFRIKPRPSFVVYGQRGMFMKADKDRQEADLKKFYLPDHDDFGLDQPQHYGTLTYYDDQGQYHEEAVPTVPGDNGRFYDALYDTLINHQPVLVTEAQTMQQMMILDRITQPLK
ncbi:Gfo/Idh/MocA family oxidoreductase [Limosilactobacillus equigenerosi]|nr:Gfo/Idh/MocA family oxidoreductase [Limosilactobacillus equigenerosi]